MEIEAGDTTGMNLALIVAAGKGTRMGAEGGKQFLPLAGKPVLAHTLAAFQQASSIDTIIVITAEENFDRCLSLIDTYSIAKANGMNGTNRVVIGGSERQDSVYNGLKAAREFERVKIAVVHDGARPLVTPRLIDDVITNLVECDGVVVGIPAKDTIKLVGGGFVVETPNRSKTWQVQTPQAFLFEPLLRAHENARAEDFYGTDDSMLMERYGSKIKVIMGLEENIKITTPVDLVLAGVIVESR
ncbi:MAG: 2-C-methyl-D-erythritol 4-phosphate cytidylyltransferase [Candidatus Aquicultor sp.]